MHLGELLGSSSPLPEESGPVCDSRVGRAKLVHRATYWSVRQGVSLRSPEIQRPSSSFLCLLRRPLCVYWLGTTQHWELSSKCRFTKGWAGGGEVCTVQAVWICWCRSPAVLDSRQMLQLRKHWGVWPGLCLALGASTSRYTLYTQRLYAMLIDGKRLDYITATASARAQTNVH